MTTTHTVRTHKSSEHLPPAEQLAGRLAALAAEQDRPLDDAAVDMVINRVIDNAAVAVASLERAPVVSARGQAEAHPSTPGATVFGLDAAQRVSPEWAAWANGVAVRELDYHDTFLAADYSHPGDNIPPILAVAQHCGLNGAALVRDRRRPLGAHVAAAQRARDVAGEDLDVVVRRFAYAFRPGQASFVGVVVHQRRRIAPTRVEHQSMRVGLLSDVHGNAVALEAAGVSLPDPQELQAVETVADVEALIAHIQKIVKDKTGVALHPEVRVVGEAA